MQVGKSRVTKRIKMAIKFIIVICGTEKAYYRQVANFKTIILYTVSGHTSDLTQLLQILYDSGIDPSSSKTAPLSLFCVLSKVMEKY